MKTRLVIGASLFGVVVALAGCGGGDNNNDNGNSPPPVPTTTDFSIFVQVLIAQQTCETTLPVDVNSLDFTFDPNQDTAIPTDVSAVSRGCTSV